MVRNLWVLGLIAASSVATGGELEIFNPRSFNCINTNGGAEFTAALATAYKTDEWGDRESGLFFIINGGENFRLEAQGGCLALGCPQAYKGSSGDIALDLTVWPEGYSGESGKQAEGMLSGKKSFTCDIVPEQTESFGGAVGGL